LGLVGTQLKKTSSLSTSERKKRFTNGSAKNGVSEEDWKPYLGGGKGRNQRRGEKGKNIWGSRKKNIKMIVGGQ